MRTVRWALAVGLNYHAFRNDRPGWLTRLHAQLLLRRLRWNCPPWVGEGRYLDVGCGSGGSLGVAKALGWKVSGIEMDKAAAAKALRFTEKIHVGDILSALFPGGGFDLVTAFHVLEHVPDPIAVVRRMLDWLAPDGQLIIEVPNAGGLGASLFGKAWSGLELPRHLAQFTPQSLASAVERAGGKMLWCWHQAKPRYYLRSIEYVLRDYGWTRLAHVIKWPPVRGFLKLILEIILPLASLARRGEVIRIGVGRVSVPMYN
jgi:SAM-dependent methyltransferase